MRKGTAQLNDANLLRRGTQTGYGIVIADYPYEAIRRFLALIAFDPGHGARVWTGGRNRDGYGVFHVRRAGPGSTVYAHRFAAALWLGQIPGDREAHHACIEHGAPSLLRICVDHLRMVTGRENMAASAVAEAYAVPL